MKFFIRTPNNSLSTNSQPISKKNCAPCPKKQSSKKPIYRSSQNKHKKIDFVSLKKNTVNSLNEVENFLCNFQNICKYIKLYKILR